MIANGQIVYSTSGWIRSRYDSACCLCGRRTHADDLVIRVCAATRGGQWAGTCCAEDAEDLSGYWALRPQAPRLGDQDFDRE